MVNKSIESLNIHNPQMQITTTRKYQCLPGETINKQMDDNMYG